MADIFISYSQKDRAWVKQLVDALTAEGYEVWWDLKIRAGESFDQLIESTLEKVSCVVGVWSKHSVKSEWVRAESAWAKDRRIFVSVRIDDDTPLPLKFYNVHTASMADWNGSRDAAKFRSLVKDLAVLAGAPKTATVTVSRRADMASVDITSPVPTLEPLSSFRDPLRDGGEGPEMVVIPTGSFWMGAADDDWMGSSYERPQHQIEITRPFALGRTPVTFAEYDRFAEAVGRTKPKDEGWGRGRRPVIHVNWDDATAYAEWLSSHTGKPYRLPTEAEWEYACRAGTHTHYYFIDKPYVLPSDWEKCLPDTDKYTWNVGNASLKTHPVGEKKPNPWGLYDVQGNVEEWLQDCWHEDYKGAPGDGSAWEEEGGGDCGKRVVRGSGWFFSDREGLLSASRGCRPADDSRSDRGFRLARDL